MKKILRKVVLCALMFLLVCGCLSGCSPITLSTLQDNSGIVVSTLTIDLQDLKTLGSYSAKVESVYDIIEMYTGQLTKSYEDRMIEVFSNKYNFAELQITDRQKKMEYITWRNTDYVQELSESPHRHADGTPGMTFSYSQVDKITITTKFASIYGYIMYFYPKALVWDEEKQAVGLDHDIYSSLIDVPITDAKIEKNNSIFFETITQTCTPFSYNGEEPQLLSSTTIKGHTYSKGTSIVSVACSVLGLDESQAEYVFKFTTPYKRVWSDGTLTLADGKYVHSWSFGSNISSQVNVSRKYANYVAWYVVGMAIGIVIVGFGCLGVFVSRKTRRKKGLEAMKKIDDFILNSSKDKNGEE